MKRIGPCIIIFISIISLVCVQGCSVDKPFVKADMTSISSLQVVRYPTPTMTEDRLWLDIVAAVTLGPLVGGALAESMLQVKKVTDFGEMVMLKFCETATKEIPGWPVMTIEEQVATDDYAFQGKVLVFRVDRLVLDDHHGLISIVTVTMKDSHGNVRQSYGNDLWKKRCIYTSRKSDRRRTISEFKADNGRLLAEEIEFAAEKTVQDFIGHFKKEATH